MTYKNERYKEGNTIKLMYNPYVEVDLMYDTDTTYSNHRDLTFKATTETATSDDIIVCNAFGGTVIVGSSSTGDYAVADYCSDYGTSYTDRITGVLTSLDTFKGSVSDNLYTDVKKYYVFDKSSSEVLESGLIGKYSVKRKVANSTYNVPYGQIVENYIIVEFGYQDFDMMCQAFASSALAVVSCNDDLPTSVTWANECDDSVYGGGSCNPIVRMGIIQDSTIKKTLHRDTFSVTIKLLG